MAGRIARYNGFHVLTVGDNNPMAGATMAKKRMGRPKTSERDDVSIKFDRVLARRARAICDGRGISIAEYLSELCRPVINKDYTTLMRELDEEQKS